eukprot:855848-Amorphochlora_amoeboformis.AAC.1
MGLASTPCKLSYIPRHSTPICTKAGLGGSSGRGISGPGGSSGFSDANSRLRWMFSSGSKPDIILEWSEVFNTAPRIRVRVRVRARSWVVWSRERIGFEYKGRAFPGDALVFGGCSVSFCLGVGVVLALTVSTYSSSPKWWVECSRRRRGGGGDGGGRDDSEADGAGGARGGGDGGGEGEGGCDSDGDCDGDGDGGRDAGAGGGLVSRADADGGGNTWCGLWVACGGCCVFCEYFRDVGWYRSGGGLRFDGRSCDAAAGGDGCGLGGSVCSFILIDVDAHAELGISLCFGCDF